MTFHRPSGPNFKEPKAPKSPAYLKAVRQLPCIICVEFSEPQLSPTTAHHPIHDRHSQRKRPDKTAIPLCEGHHQGLWDTSKVAIHKSPELWRQMYGADHEWIERIQDMLIEVKK